MPLAPNNDLLHRDEPQLWTPPQHPLVADSFLPGTAAMHLPARLLAHPSSPHSIDSETLFFLREARVTKDTLVHLTEDDDGFDDILFLKCQGFLKSHATGVNARRKMRAEVQERAVLAAARRRHVTRMARIQHFVDDPRSSRGAFYFFVFIATLVVVSCVTTIVSTLPAYNPIVKDEYLVLWNVIDLILGGIFTVETGLRLVACVFDRTLPTSTWQNAYRFFTKPTNLVDLVSITPSYVQLFVSPKSRVITGTLRTVRLLRLFKILRFYKPVRMLQKALRFAAKGLLAPMLFLVTTLVFISAGVYFAEHGDYDERVHKFLIDEDPVCIFEPSYFLSLEVRAPEYLANQNTSTAPPTTMAPIWDTLPPRSGSASSSSTWGSKDTESLPDPHGQAYIDHLDCPVSEASFVTIMQSSWWAIATMSSAGFGDFVTVTGIGRVLAVFGILTGIILNAMPIAVIDASFVATLQTEEDQDAREKAKKQQMDASVKLSAAGRGGGNHSFDGMPASVDSLFLNNMLAATSGGDNSENGSLGDLGASFLGGKNPSFFVRSVEMEDRVREQQLDEAATPRTHVEVLLLHLHLLSRHDVIDLANPSDDVLYLMDVLLDAAVTNTAVDVVQWRNRHLRAGGAWASVTVDDGGGGSGKAHRQSMLVAEAWCPSPQQSLPIWLATTETNLAREAQAAGYHTAHPVGERREIFSERHLLSKPVRWTLGARGLGNIDEFTDGATDDDDHQPSSPVSRTGFTASQRRPVSRSCAYQQDDGIAVDAHACILDAALMKRLQRSRSDAIARAMLLGGGRREGGGGNGPALNGGNGGNSRRSTSGLRASSIISRQSSEEEEEEDISDDDDSNITARQGGHRSLGAQRTNTPHQLRLQPMELLAILEAHCWLVLHQAWGQTHTLLVPRRPPSSLPLAPCGAEEEPMTVQILRYSASSMVWEAVIPFATQNAIALNAPPGTAHNFRCRMGQAKNRLSVGAPLMCSSRDHASMDRNVPVSTHAERNIARQLLSQVRQRSHFDVRLALGKQLAASRMTYRAQRVAKEQEDAKKARSAKAKKDAETRELLDALSSEKKEAYAILQRLDMEVGEAASSDRLSLLALASTAADRLERERTAERNIAQRRFALMERIAAEEQSPRYRLEPGDIILFFGGGSASASLGGAAASGSAKTLGVSLSSARQTTCQIASVLPSRDGIRAFAEKRRAEQRGLQRAADAAVASPVSPTSPWQRLDALTPHLGHTLLYVYQGP